MRRGEIWYAVWPKDPAQKPRPILIVSNNHRNLAPHLLDIVVVKLTGLYRDDGTKKPVNQSEDVVVKFKKETIIQCGAIFSIEKRSLQSHLTQLPIALMRDVDDKLKNVLDLH